MLFLCVLGSFFKKKHILWHSEIYTPHGNAQKWKALSALWILPNWSWLRSLFRAIWHYQHFDIPVATEKQNKAKSTLDPCTKFDPHYFEKFIFRKHIKQQLFSPHNLSETNSNICIPFLEPLGFCLWEWMKCLNYHNEHFVCPVYIHI